MLPLNGFAWRINLLSAVFGALSCGLVYLALKNLLENTWAASQTNRGKCSLIVSLGSALFFAFSWVMWSQSINAEVYSLQVFLTGLLLYLFSEIDRQGPASQASQVSQGLRLEQTHFDSRQKRLLTLLVLVYGLSYGSHPITLGFIPPFVYFFWLNRRTLLTHRRFFVTLAAAFLFSGLLPYLYIPLRSLQNPPLDWGDPQTLSSFLRHITASHWTAGEASKFGIFQPAFLENLSTAALLTWKQFHFPGLLLAITGVAYLFRKKKIFSWLLLLGFVSTLAVAGSYRTGEVENWLTPAWLILSVWMGAGLFAVVGRFKKRPVLWAVALSAVLAFFPLVLNYPRLDRSQNYYAEDYGRNLLENLPLNSILLLTGDAPLSSTVFIQQVLGERQDVCVFQKDALYRAWYRRKLRRNLRPDVILPEWRCGPKPASHEVFRCSKEYLLEFISENADTFPIFEILPDPVPGFRLVPSGIVYRITRDPTLEPDPKHWDFSFHDEEFDQPPDLIEGYNDAIITVLNGYIAAYKNLADWYFWKKKLAPQAARCYEKTLKLIKAHSKYRAFDQAFQVQMLNSAGIAHSEAGDYELAMQNIDLGLELAPFDASLYINKAVIWKKQGNLEGSRKACLEALRLEPDNAVALSLLKKM